MNAPLLISLPHGFNASGVTTWAVRLANTLAASGRLVALVVHDEPPGQQSIDFRLDPRVELFDARGLRPMDQCEGDLSEFLPVYRMALGVLATRSRGVPVVCSPNLLGDSYGVFAAMSRETPEIVRVIAVHHSDMRYNDAVCAHYADLVHTFVGVSEQITRRLRRLAGNRRQDVYGIPYGVETPPAVLRREPLAGRSIRLLYAGRMDHEQKRIGAILVMADSLRRSGVPFELALLGDGPAAADIDTACAQIGGIRRFGAVPPAGVAAALDAADLFVLPSRYEGLSVALLEALAHGCVPVLTPSASGTGQLIRDGLTGLLAGAGPESSVTEAGMKLAEAVRYAVLLGDTGLHEMRCQGLTLITERFSAGLCAERYARMLDRVAARPARPWPRGRSSAFTGAGGGGSGTVPPDAPGRMSTVLRALAGRRVAVYGTGRHTLELRDTLQRGEAEIVAFVDDDAARQGGELWGRPVLALDEISLVGATDVVVSSWLHEDQMRRRCQRLERAGVRVHTLYNNDAAPVCIV